MKHMIKELTKRYFIQVKKEDHKSPSHPLRDKMLFKEKLKRA